MRDEAPCRCAAINDVRELDLILLGGVTGKETGGHDWNNILTMLGWLEYDHRLAHLAYNLGILLMLASFAWGRVVTPKTLPSTLAVTARLWCLDGEPRK